MDDIAAKAKATTTNTIMMRRSNNNNNNKTKNKARVLLVGTGTMGKIRAPLLYSNPKFELCGICDEYDYESAVNLALQYSTTAFHTIDEAIIFHCNNNNNNNNSNNKPIIQNSPKKKKNKQQQQQQQHDDDDADQNNNGKPLLLSRQQQQQQKQKQHYIDGVIISVRTEFHAKYIEAAVKYGLTGIFVEKPVAESSTEICRLYDLCDEKDDENNNNYNNGVKQRKLCCGFQRRFDDSYIAAAHACKSNQIGKILSAHIFFGDSPCPPIDFLITGGNIFHDLAVHDVDFIRYALDDDVASVFATATYSSKELEKHDIHDNATMVMMFKKGAMVTLTLSRWSCYGYDQRCEIFGDNGMVSVGSQHTTTTVVYNQDGEHHSRLAESYPQRFSDAFAKELDAFANTILDDDNNDNNNSQKHKKWPVTKTDAIAVQAIAQAADRSCKSKCVVDV